MNGFHGKYRGDFKLKPVARNRWKLVSNDVFMYGDLTHQVAGGSETDLASVPYKTLIIVLILVNQVVVNVISQMYALSEYPGNIAWGILGGCWLLAVVGIIFMFPSINDTARPAIHHDMMYREQMPRAEADRYFYHGLRIYIGRFWATMFWLAVRLGGWWGYARYKKRWDKIGG